MLAGGVANPDQLRTVPETVAFVRSMFQAGKPPRSSATARLRVVRRSTGQSARRSGEAGWVHDVCTSPAGQAPSGMSLSGSAAS